jgi:hypothetical protein
MRVDSGVVPEVFLGRIQPPNAVRMHSEQIDALFRIMATEIERAKSMREMNARRVTITMRDGNVFHGYINIGTCRRLSDFFGKSDSSPFVVMFDTTIGESKGKKLYFINRNHIVSVRPDELDDRPFFPGSMAIKSELK